MRLLLPPSRSTAPGGTTRPPGARRPVPIDWYTGTLYKALAVDAWSRPERDYALRHVVLHDRDLGLVAAGSWAPIDPAGLSGLVVDARSKEYIRLVPTPAGAWTLRVVSEGLDGRRIAVSHWNKHHKGVLARALIRDRPRIGGVNDLVAWSLAAGLRLEVVAAGALDLVVAIG